MSRYDFELDLSLNTSTGKILDKIKKYSRVLEFGCAEGRMTRYMKEELSCEVYICEYNEEAFRNALKYAVDGVCGDILNFEWLEKFKDIRFDAILFVDVLEHLTDSVGALKKAGMLLSDEGEVLISIPNVTHNDILLKEIEEHFDYTTTGLLDDTHVHFWGRENITAFVESAGLSVRKIEGTYLETGFTEQLYKTGIHEYSPYLINLLKERDCGEIYQFIITCVKQESSNAGELYDTTKKANTVTGELYFNRGTGFSESDKRKITSVLVEKGVYHTEINLDDVADLKEIRFDPIDNQPCIILNAVATQGKNDLDIVYPRCIMRDRGVLIYGNDPMMVIPIESEGEPVNLTVEFILLSDRYTDYVNELSFELDNENCLLEKRITELEKNISNLHIEKQKVEYENAKIPVLNAEINALNAKINTLNIETKILLEDYRKLVTKKDLLLIELRNGIKDKDACLEDLNNEMLRKEEQLVDLNEEIAKNNQEIKQLSEEVDHYRGLFVIRVRRFCGRVLRKVKHVFGGNK